MELLTFSEWLDDREEFCLGWLGWSPDQLDDALLHRVEIARAGRMAMLKAIFGEASSDDTSGPIGPPVRSYKTGEPITISPKLFDKMFGAGKPRGSMN